MIFGMKSDRANKHVALLIESSNAYARGLLRGVHKYVTLKSGWSTYTMEHSRLQLDASWLTGWHGNGIIARVETEATADLVLELGLPAVDLSAARLIPHLPGVETDDRRIAALASTHFAERGLRHFGFCGDSRFVWSLRRHEAFEAQVEALGGIYHEFSMHNSTSSAEDRRALEQWLKDIPKPIGVLACYDLAAQEVLEACKTAGIRVPDDVAVVGVDNDELITTITSPPLSSIQSDSVRAGYLAAQLLDRVMAGQDVAPGLRRVPPVRLVPRQSSALLYTDDVLVRRALNYIVAHQDQRQAVADVCHAAGSSRRALDQRFVAAIGRTVHAEILRVRMAHVAQMLITTELTIEQIAHRLNFVHAENLSVMFKREMGVTPGEYRRNVHYDLN